MSNTTDTLARLVHVGEIARVLLDGDEASRIITGDAMYHLANESEEFRHLTLDHYNVDGPTFVRMKKLLLRLERLADVPVNSSLWVPVGTTGRVTVALQNGNVNRFYEFGQRSIEMPDAMVRCFKEAVVVELPPEDGKALVTALSPVFDSMEEVAAVLELSAAISGSTGAEYA